MSVETIYFRDSPIQWVVNEATGEPAYVLIRLGELLEIKNHRSATIDFGAEERVTCKVGGKNMVCLTKKGVKRLLNKSIKPHARDMLQFFESQWNNNSPSASQTPSSPFVSSPFPSPIDSPSPILSLSLPAPIESPSPILSTTPKGKGKKKNETGTKNEVICVSNKVDDSLSNNNTNNTNNNNNNNIHNSNNNSNNNNNNNNIKNKKSDTANNAKLLTYDAVSKLIDNLKDILSDVGSFTSSNTNELESSVASMISEFNNSTTEKIVITATGNSQSGKSFIFNTMCMSKFMKEPIKKFMEQNGITEIQKSHFAQLQLYLRNQNDDIGYCPLPSTKDTKQTTSIPYYINFVGDDQPVTVTRVYTPPEEFVRRVKSEMEEKNTTAADHWCVAKPEGIEVDSNHEMSANLGEGIIEYQNKGNLLEIAKEVAGLLWQDLENLQNNVNLNMASDYIQIEWPNSDFDGIQLRDLAGANAESGWRKERISSNTSDTNVIFLVTSSRFTYAQATEMSNCDLISDDYEILPQLLVVLNSGIDAIFPDDRPRKVKNINNNNNNSKTYLETLKETTKDTLDWKKRDTVTGPFVIPNLSLETREWKLKQMQEKAKAMFYYRSPVTLNNGQQYDFFLKLKKLINQVKREQTHRRLLPIVRKARSFQSEAMKAVTEQLLKESGDELKAIQLALNKNLQRLDSSKEYNKAVVANYSSSAFTLPYYQIGAPFMLMIRNHLGEGCEKVYEFTSSNLAKQLTKVLMTNSLHSAVAIALRKNVDQIISQSKIITANIKTVISTIFQGDRGELWTYMRDNLLYLASDMRDKWKLEMKDSLDKETFQTTLRHVLDSQIQESIKNALDYFKKKNPESSQDDTQLEEIITRAVADAVKSKINPNIKNSKSIGKIKKTILSFHKKIDDYFKQIVKSARSKWATAKKSGRIGFSLSELREKVYKMRWEIKGLVSKNKRPRIMDSREVKQVDEFYFVSADTPKEMDSKTVNSMDNQYIAWAKQKLKQKNANTKTQTQVEVYEEYSKDNFFGKLISVDINVKPGVHRVNIPLKLLDGINESKKNTDKYLPPIFAYGMTTAQLQVKLMEEMVPRFEENRDRNAQKDKIVYQALNTQFLLPLNFSEDQGDMVEKIVSFYENRKNGTPVYFYRIPKNFSSLNQNCELIFLMAKAINNEMMNINPSGTELAFYMASLRTNVMRRYNKNTLELTTIPFCTALNALKKTYLDVEKNIVAKGVGYFASSENKEKIFDIFIEKIAPKAVKDFHKQLHSIESRHDIKKFVDNLPSCTEKDELVHESTGNFARIGPISIADQKNGDYRYIQRDREVKDENYRDSAHVTGFCLLSTVALEQYEFVYLQRDKKKEQEEDNEEGAEKGKGRKAQTRGKGKGKAQAKGKGNSKGKGKGKDKGEGGKLKSPSNIRYDAVIRKLLEPYRKRGLLCYLCFEYEFRNMKQQDISLFSKKVHGSGGQVLQLPSMDLAEYKAAPIALVESELAKQNFELQAEQEDIKIEEDDEDDEEEEKEEEEEEEEDIKVSSLYLSLACATTGVASKTVAKGIQNEVEYRIGTHYKTLSKTEYFKKVVMKGKIKSETEQKQQLREYAKSSPEGTPLHLYLWALYTKTPLCFIALNSSVSPNSLYMFEHKIRRSTAPPVCIALVAQAVTRKYMLVAPIKKIETPNEEGEGSLKRKRDDENEQVLEENIKSNNKRRHQNEENEENEEMEIEKEEQQIEEENKESESDIEDEEDEEDEEEAIVADEEEEESDEELLFV